MPRGDIVRHKRHGVGVVLTTSQICQVRFFRGMGQIDSDKLTVLLSASHAESFLSETLKTGKIADDLVRGMTLWIRSDDPDLHAIGLAALSNARDARLVGMVEESLAQFKPGIRSRVTRQLSEARGERGLDSWPETLRAIDAERESRRLREEAEREAQRAAVELARSEAALAAAVRSQIAIVARIRLRLGRPALAEAEQLQIGRAVRARAAAPSEYRNICWNCHTPLHSTLNPNCPECGWLVCTCGGCRSPTYVDVYGRHWACPQEAALLSMRGREA
jgi:hypothetical protein